MLLRFLLEFKRMTILNSCRHVLVFDGRLRRIPVCLFRRFNIGICLVSAIVLVLQASNAHARKWTDKTGKFSVEADYVDLTDGKVVLKKTDGNVISVPLDRLSDADQQYVESQRNPQKYVTFPKAGVKLIQPRGFFEVESFEGFHQESTTASVIALKIPDPYAAAIVAFDAKTLKANGMTLQSKEDITIDGKKGILLSVLQSANGTDYVKWVAVFGGEKTTNIITGMCPKTHEAKLSAELKSVVLSAKAAD
jgi:hypothetical protein